MHELPNIIPDVATIWALEPEEFGVKILFFMRKRLERSPRELFSVRNQSSEPFGHNNSGQAIYPDHERDRFYQAMAEAWSWLEAQGLLVVAPGMNGAGGFRILSRRARRFEEESEILRFGVSRLIAKDSLHPKIAASVWSAFIRSDFDVAVFQAMKGVEIAVREGAGFGNDKTGVQLMTSAFKEGGPLSDKTMEPGEKVARINLFAGAIGSYKNPHSHRDIKLENPAEAVEIVLLANHLLRIVDARRIELIEGRI